MSTRLGQPICTASWPLCGCEADLPPDQELGPFVSKVGEAVCACHDQATADRLKVEQRFPCEKGGAA